MRMKLDGALLQTLTILFAALALGILFVLGVYLIMLEPLPEEIPIAVIDIRIEGVEEEYIILTHRGGDSLTADNSIIRVNGVEISPLQMEFLHEGEWPWSPGSEIQIRYPHIDLIRTVEVFTITQREKKELLQNRVTFIPPEKVEAAPLPVKIFVTFAPTPVPTIIEVVQEDANPIVPISSDFTADFTVGDPPLTVQFWDLSRGAPSQYLWNFGDGITSDQKNPIHTYFVPGSYDVSLRASNAFHTDYKEVEGFITIGLPPAAEFFADPTNGFSPLTVVFTDLSTGSPKNWEWSFGDGATSNERNPFHIYQSPGIYTVGLTASNAYGTSKEAKQDYIIIRAPTVHDVFLSESPSGFLVNEGSITLRVLQGPSSVKIGGRIITFEIGDIVQFIVNNGMLDGQIYIANNSLHEFQFPDVTLLVNNVFVARGSINSVRIGKFDSYKSTLAIRVPTDDGYTSLFIDSQPIGYPTRPQMLLLALGPDYSGKMSYKKSARALNYQGGIGSYQIA